MKSAPPAPRRYNPGMRPVLNLLERLAGHQGFTHLSIQKSGFRMELRRHADPSRPEPRR